MTATAKRAPDYTRLADQVAQATAANERGRPALAVRRFRRALADLREASDLGRDIDALRARALLGLATSSFEVGGEIGPSLELLQQAEALAGSAGAPHLVAGVRNNRGLLLLRSGSTDEAMSAFDEAVQLLDIADPVDGSRILLNRGTLHMETGSVQSARDDLTRASRLAAKAGDRLLEFKSRHNLGYVEFLAGNLPRALAVIAEAGDIDPGGPHAIVLLDQARILREAGLGRDAMASLTRATGLFRRDRLVQDLGETELAKAEVALVNDDPLTARRAAESALRQFKRRSNVRWQRKAELVVISSEIRAAARAPRLARGRRLADLARQSRSLAQLCRSEDRRDLARAADLLEAECVLSGTAIDAAAVAALPSLAMSRSDPLTLRLQIRALRARAAEVGGDDPRARREIRAGLSELAAHQSSVGSLDLRTASAVHGVALARQDLAMSLRRQRPAEVFASIERGRAFSTRLAPVRPPGDAETAEMLSRLRRIEEAARTASGDPGRAAEVSALRAEATEVQQQVRARGWHHEASARVSAAANLASVRDALLEFDGAAVSFVAHEGRWLACVVNRGRTDLHDLAPVERVQELTRRIVADLDVLALSNVPAALRAAVHASLSAQLRAMDDLLLTPLRLAGRPLVLSPGGILALLPWPALPSARGVPLVVTPSTTSWLAARRTKRPSTGSPTVVAVAGPGLERSVEEAGTVADVWAAPPALVGAAATVTTTRRLLGAGTDVLHIAAHGVHQTESPLFSSVRLADGPLFAYELDPAQGMAGLVVLSACEVGLSTVRPGDEALGLTSVLLRLGATSVVAGVARVGDDQAVTVMSGLHRRLAAGSDTATALAETLADLDEPAPFVCFGSSWAS